MKIRIPHYLGLTPLFRCSAAGENRLLLHETGEWKKEDPVSAWLTGFSTDREGFDPSVRF